MINLCKICETPSFQVENPIQINIAAPIRRQSYCKICHQPGHRKKNCPATSQQLPAQGTAALSYGVGVTKSRQKGTKRSSAQIDAETRSHAVDDDDDEVADDEEDGDDAIIEGEAQFDQLDEADDNVQDAANEKDLDALGDTTIPWIEQPMDAWNPAIHLESQLPVFLAPKLGPNKDYIEPLLFGKNTPVSFFMLYLTPLVLAAFVCATNCYGRRKFTKPYNLWKDLTINEFKSFFAVI